MSEALTKEKKRRLTNEGHEFISDTLGYKRGKLELATDEGKAIALRMGLFLASGKEDLFTEAHLVDEAWEQI